MAMDTEIKGAQTVFRAVSLLKLVALHHQEGATLPTLCEGAQLERTTAYRLLSSLVQTGLIERDTDKSYRLGLEAMQLGLAAMSRAPILERCRPPMMRIARRTEDTVFLVVRNGDYAHCLHCEEGSFPVKALVLQVGGMRLLGEGSAGVALLATLAEAEIDALHKRNRGDGGPTLAHLRKLVAQTRRQGYSTTENLVADGVSGVGMSFEVANGAHAAISVAAISSRMRDDRRRWIAELMAEELRTAGWNPPDTPARAVPVTAP
jgi:DNA-binding IclR family transcriptional regulator